MHRVAEPERSQGPLNGGRGRVGMALYGDLTYDSRVQKEARSLVAAGYAVTLVCLASDPALAALPEGCRVLVLRPGTAVIPGSSNPFVGADARNRGGLLQRVAWLSAYVRGLREWGRLAVKAVAPVDVWHLHDLTALAAILPRLDAGAQVIYDSHELFLEQGTAERLPAPVRRLLRRYERRLVSRTAAVITVNDEIASILARRYRPARLAVVHNCPALWAPPTLPSSLIRDALDIPPNERIVLYHGGLIGGRGVEQLMEALLRDGLEDVHLVLMGYGDKRQEFLDAARSPRWRQRVHVLDPVAPAALLPWVASADVGAMPNPGLTQNDRLSSPNKLFECLAAGTPVIGSDFVTMRRIIVDNPDGPLGAVCDPSQAESIAAALRAILEQEPADMEALRSRCRRAATTRWNWDKEVEGMLSLYAEILCAPNGTVPFS